MKLRAKNVHTGEVYMTEVTQEEIEDTLLDGVCPCSGPCECNVEPDGTCPEGWPSVLLAMGVI